MDAQFLIASLRLATHTALALKSCLMTIGSWERRATLLWVDEPVCVSEAISMSERGCLRGREVPFKSDSLMRPTRLCMVERENAREL